MSFSTMAIELCVFKKKKKKKKTWTKWAKTFLGIIFTFGAFFTEIFGIQFSFHILSAVKLLNVESESKN